MNSNLAPTFAPWARTRAATGTRSGPAGVARRNVGGLRACAALWLVVLAAPGLAAPAAVPSNGVDTLPTASLSLAGARRVLTAALAFAQDQGAPGGAVAIVDAGGHPVLVERLDGTFPAAADISVGKARTAVMFRRPTRGLEETINQGRDAMIPVAAVTWFTPLQGGVPLVVDGRVVGGVGVSGAASAQQDEAIAVAAAAALSSPAAAAVTERVAAGTVTAAYARGDSGDTLLTRESFRVNASRRDRPGEAEVHLRETDIFHVVEGRAVVVTGGEVLAPRHTGPGEIRGSALRGGAEHSLGPGDVLTIPAGVPHWFREVRAPFRYFVVKSIAGG